MGRRYDRSLVGTALCRRRGPLAYCVFAHVSVVMPTRACACMCVPLRASLSFSSLSLSLSLSRSLSLSSPSLSLSRSLHWLLPHEIMITARCVLA